MPTLPDVTAFGQSPTPQPSSGVASYTPTIGREMQQAGAMTQNAAAVFAETNLRQDAMVAQDAVNKLKAARMTLQYDKDGWSGKREGQTVGKEFIDGYAQKLTDAQEKIGEKLTQSQKAIFDRHAEVETMLNTAGLMQHQATETTKFNDSVDNSKVTLALQSIAQRPDDKVNFGIQMEYINAAVLNHGKRNGLDPGMIEVNQGKARTAAYVSRIEALMHGVPGILEPDPDAANKLFTDVEPILSPEAIRHLSPQLMVAGVASNAQKIGVPLSEKYNYTQTGAALKELDGMNLAPALKTAVQSVIEHRHVIQQSDADKAQAEGVSKVMEKVYSGMPASKVVASPEFMALRDKGAALKAIQDYQYTQTLRANANSQRDLLELERNEKRIYIQGAAKAFEFMNPETLASTPREKIEMQLPVLGRQWTQELLNRKDSLEKRNPQDAKIDHDDMMAVMVDMKMKPFEKNKTEDGKALITTTQSRIERALTQMQAGGKILTREQKVQLMREEVAKTVTVENMIFPNDKNVPVAELTTEQLGKIVIPPKDKAEVATEMADLYRRSAGKLKQFEPTKENLARYWLTYRKESRTANMIP